METINVQPKSLLKMSQLDDLIDQESAILERFITNGYAQAAQSFSQILNHEVTVGSLQYNICTATTAESADCPPIFYYGKTMTLVLTDIMGQAPGRSYLLLSDRECQQLQSLGLSESQRSEEMTEAFIKEVDNILSAAAISEFCTALRTLIFGGVPRLHTLPLKDMEATLTEDFAQSKQEGYGLMSSARFLVKGHPDLQPQFLWNFSSAFLDHLKKYIDLTIMSGSG